MCDLALARTGFDGALPLALGVLFVLAGVAVLLLRARRSRGGAMLALVLIAGSALALSSSPAPAMAADCPPAAYGQQAMGGGLTAQAPGDGTAPQGAGGTDTDPVTSAPASAVITASPTGLELAAGDSGTFIITNVSTVTAVNLVPTMAAVPGITIDLSTCLAALAPGASCTIGVTTTNVFAGGAALVLSGSNTNTLELAVGVLPPTTVSGPPAVAFPGATTATRDVVLTNTGSERAAFRTPSITGSADLASDLGDCATGLAPGDSCVAHITFTRVAGHPFPPSTLALSGNFPSIDVPILVLF